MRGYGLLFGLAGVFLLGAAAAQPPPGDPTSMPARGNDQQSDLVTPLIVRAVDTGGPAWWRVADANSVVWIMGVPDWLPKSVKFDETRLRKHLDGAAALLTEQPKFERGPPQTVACVTPKPGPTYPYCDWFYRGQPEQTTYPPLPSLARFELIPRLDLPQTVPADLMPSVKALEAKYGGSLEKPMPLQPNWNDENFDQMVGWQLSVFEFRAMASDAAPFSNSAVEEAIRIAKADKVPVQTIAFGAQSAASVKRDYIGVQSLATRQACLRQVVEALGKVDTLPFLAKVWAGGDYQNGLRNMVTLDLCPLPAVDPYMWGRLVTERFAGVRDLLQKPGISVALLWLDPLLVKGGALDLLKSAGYEVETPEQLEE